MTTRPRDPAAGVPRSGRAARVTSPGGPAPSTPPEGAGGREPRTWRLELPAGLPLLNLNDRSHWAVRYRRTEALKKAAWALALQQKIPRLERVSIIAEYQPGDMRHRDPDNIATSVKAAIDGIRRSGCLPEDDSRHVAEVTCRIGPLYPKGRLVLFLTEIPATAGGDAA